MNKKWGQKNEGQSMIHSHTLYMYHEAHAICWTHANYHRYSDIFLVDENFILPVTNFYEKYITLYWEFFYEKHEMSLILKIINYWYILMAAIFMFLRYGVAIGNKSDVREMAMLNKASEHQNITSHIKS